MLCLAVNYSSNYSYLILTNVLRFNFYFQLFHLVKKCYITHSVLVVVSNCSSWHWLLQLDHCTALTWNQMQLLTCYSDGRKCLKLPLAFWHTLTHTFNGPLSGTTQVSRYQKGKTNLDFTEARDTEGDKHKHFDTRVDMLTWLTVHYRSVNCIFSWFNCSSFDVCIPLFCYVVMSGTSSISFIDSPLSSSITPSLFHSRLETFFLQILSSIAFLFFSRTDSTDYLRTVYQYFWAYPFLVFLFTTC